MIPRMTRPRSRLARWPGRLGAAFTGHLWTLAPHVRARFWPTPLPPHDPWSVTVDDPLVGSVQLTGALHVPAGAETCVILVHGLGGNADAGYCVDAAAAAARRGWASLRIFLRGADGQEADLYHAGLASDLGAAIDSPQLQRFERILIVGFSLGGHTALRYALDPSPRVRAVTAVCSPLDLRASGVAIDRRRATPYRTHVLDQLKSAYRRVALRQRIASLATIDAVQKIREWDSKLVVPRFGFDDVDDYYDRMAVGPHLADLKVPSLYVGAPGDPMVPAATVQPSLDAAGPDLMVKWADRSGHVGFADRSMIAQIVEWTGERGRI